MCNGGWGACEGQALALRVSGCVFFVVRVPVPRDRFLILFILQILAILLQTRAIKGLSDLFSWLLLRFYRHEGLPDLFSLILAILIILAILLQTREILSHHGPLHRVAPTIYRH